MKAPFRTISDLMAAAQAAASPQEAESCLATAVAQAGDFQDWDKILESLPSSLSAERRRELLTQSLASAQKREEIWGFRTAAVMQAGELSDPDLARATLGAAERLLTDMAQNGRAYGFYWGIVAEAYKLALHDDGEVRRCLLAGWEFAWAAQDVENLGRLANQWNRHLAPAEAVERLRSVEQAARGWGNLGDVIYWWHALGDAAAGRRVRQESLESATQFEAALDLARYWDLYDKDCAGIDAAFVRAEALAQTAEEWFELASVADAKSKEAGLSRRALDRAAALADTPALKTCVAAAYVDWFQDEAAAAQVGPRGLRPDELRQQQTRLAECESSASELFDWLRQRVTKEQLADIAEADYGDDAPRHLAALTEICGTGLVPLSLSWHPKEVLALTRWSSGDSVDHLQRALCCVLLCLAGDDDELANTGPPLVESCLVLGEAAPVAAEHFLAWLYETAEPDSQTALVALFLLFLLHAQREPGGSGLAALLRLLGSSPAVRSLREWMADSLRAELWEKLVADIVTPLHRDYPELSSLLAAIGLPP